MPTFASAFFFAPVGIVEGIGVAKLSLVISESIRCYWRCWIMTCKWTACGTGLVVWFVQFLWRIKFSFCLWTYNSDYVINLHCLLYAVLAYVPWFCYETWSLRLYKDVCTVLMLFTFLANMALIRSIYSQLSLLNGETKHESFFQTQISIELLVN